MGKGIGEALDDVDGAVGGEGADDDSGYGSPSLEGAMLEGDEGMLVQDGNGAVKRATAGKPKGDDEGDEESEDDDETSGDDETGDDEEEDGSAKKAKGKSAKEDGGKIPDEHLIETTFGQFDGRKFSKPQMRAIRRTDRTIQRLNSDLSMKDKEIVRLRQESDSLRSRGGAMKEVAAAESKEDSAFRRLQKAQEDGEGVSEARKAYQESVRATERAKLKAGEGEDDRGARKDDGRGDDSSRAVRYSEDDLADDAEEFLEDMGAESSVDADKFTDLVVQLMNHIPEWERTNKQKFYGGNVEAQKTQIMRHALKISRDAMRKGGKRSDRASKDVGRRDGRSKDVARLPLSKQRFVRPGSKGSDRGKESSDKSNAPKKERPSSLSDVMHGL